MMRSRWVSVGVGQIGPALHVNLAGLARYPVLDERDMANWHIRINGTPWCCRGDLEPEPSPAVRAALLNVCCGQASMAEALSVKAALAEMGYAAWDDIEIVQSACELRDTPEQG
jgi:hypothetical protein